MIGTRVAFRGAFGPHGRSYALHQFRNSDSESFRQAVEVTWKIVLQNLRSKLRNRRALIAACSHQEFLSYSRQFFAFVEATPALKALIIELLARNSECEKREFAAMHRAFIAVR
jgi:sulfur relay (sulfurtransferase) DsrC/TusE family protein